MFLLLCAVSAGCGREPRGGVAGTDGSTGQPAADGAEAVEAGHQRPAPQAERGGAARSGVYPVDYTPPSTDGYVGDAACVECHGGISHAFSAHPMARSITPVDLEAEKRRLGSDEQAVVGSEEFHYLAEVDDGQLWHRQRKLGNDGEVIFSQGKPVQHVVGSGNRALAYLSHRQGLLFMSPLNWYREAEAYDFAPTHSAGDARRFGRRAGQDCLSCHAGRVNELRRNSSRYGSPPFQQAAIGCENCHGPGATHVRIQRGDAGQAEFAAGDPIVNPATLDHQRQEAVCYQCHLHAPARVLRPERSHFDFRPGDRLDNVWAMLVNDSTVTTEGKTDAISHVQQMHASRCYRESEGRLGCISCHDPHSVPSPDERVAFYRDRCVNCHTAESCLGEPVARASVDDSCVDCHMPARDTETISHVSQTDHRVIRPGAGTIADRGSDGEPSGGGPPPELRFLWDTASRLPEWERRRTRGIAMWLTGSGRGGRPPLEIVETLGPIARKHPDDGTVQTVLGAFWMQYGAPGRARPFFEMALDDVDVRETALSNLLTIRYLAAEWELALKLSERLLEINPEDARVQSLRSDILANLGRDREAIEAAKSALEFNPTLVPVRDYLIRLYERTGDAAAASRHREILAELRDED